MDYERLLDFFWGALTGVWIVQIISWLIDRFGDIKNKFL